MGSAAALLCLLLCATAFADDGVEGSAFRVTAISVDLTLEPEAGTILEQVTLDVEGTDVRSLVFGFNDWLTVERSHASEGFIEHQKGAGELRVQLSPPLDGRRRLRFRISGRPRRGAVMLVDRKRAVLGAGDRWYPVARDCWAQARVTVRAPEDWTVVAPGRPDAAGRRWAGRSPVRTLAVAAAPGLHLDRSTVVETPLWVASESPGDGARLAERLTPSLAWFASRLRPYPFDGFRVALVPDLPHRARGSGMLAVPAETPIEGPADAADLLAGQWFGEWLAGEGVWMDAFASWYAVEFARSRGLDPPAELIRLRKEYLRMPSRRDVALSRADVLAVPEVRRGKGSAVPAMIRQVVGEKRVGEAVAELFEGPPRPVLSLSDMRAVFEKHAGSTLLRAFADWFDRSGAPELRTELRTRKTDDGTWRADLTLEQMSGIYSLPVDVVFQGRGETHREIVRIDEERTSVYYLLPFEPTRVEIDPQGKLFLRSVK